MIDTDVRHHLSVKVLHPSSHDVSMHQDSVVSSHPSVAIGIPVTSRSVVFVSHLSLVSEVA